MVMTAYTWTDGTGNHLAGTAANWAPAAVPSSGDYVYLGSGGSNTDCLVNIANWALDRILADNSYTHSLSILSGNVVTTTNEVVQYGILAMGSGATLNVGDFYDGYGLVTTAGGSTATIAAAGSFFLYSSGTITVTGAVTGGNVLDVSSAGFDDAGTINVGLSGTAGTMSITGPITLQSSGTINVDDSSALSFFGGGGGSHPDLQGAFNLGTSSGSATVSTDTQLDIDGGTFFSTGSSTNSVAGDVRVYNGGVMEVDVGSTLTSTSGSTSIEATLNLDTGSMLAFPSASASTFTATGVINMYGAIIAMDPGRVSTLNVTGYLNTYGASGPFGLTVNDGIVGNLTNNGQVVFGGPLHQLQLAPLLLAGGGDYTQGSSGQLSMRLDIGGVSDGVAVGGATSLAGTLTLTGLHTLTGGATWTLIGTTGSFSGNFGTINWPDANPNWVANPGAAYTVSN
ncbi:MAG: hypothetical protein U0793_19765 [Gemmataceae bacterium]